VARTWHELLAGPAVGLVSRDSGPWCWPLRRSGVRSSGRRGAGGSAS